MCCQYVTFEILGFNQCPLFPRSSGTQVRSIQFPGSHSTLSHTAQRQNIAVSISSTNLYPHSSLIRTNLVSITNPTHSCNGDPQNWKNLLMLSKIPTRTYYLLLIFLMKRTKCSDLTWMFLYMYAI